MGKHCADVFRPLDLVMGQVARWASRGLAQASLPGVTMPLGRAAIHSGWTRRAVSRILAARGWFQGWPGKMPGMYLEQ